MPSRCDNNLNLSCRLEDLHFRQDFFRRNAEDSIASQIRYLREIRGLKQSDLAAAARMKQSAISRIENSKYRGWTFQTLLRICEALDAELRILMTPSHEVIESVKMKEVESTQKEETKIDVIHRIMLDEQRKYAHHLGQHSMKNSVILYSHQRPFDTDAGVNNNASENLFLRNINNDNNVGGVI